jgi:2-alkyl-3-oxoalkanoate reductase
VSERLNVVTGATGLLGSHLAEQLRRKGERVRALVRPGSDTAFLSSVGVELAEGDLTDADSLRRAVAGADVVYHAAAKVGDWAPWRLFEDQVIGGTANVLAACKQAGVGRVLHVSSISVYGHPKPRGNELFTEDEPLGQALRRREFYARAKLQAEEVCRAYPGALTIVRPSWIYGERDRNSLPRMFKALEAGRVRVMGQGNNLLNIIYAGDVAAGAILAANHPGAVGRAYNLSSEGEVTQRQMIDLVTDALGRPRVAKRVPYRLAYFLGWFSEVVGKAIRIKRPPYITRYVVQLVGRPTLFSTARARSELGWKPQVSIAEGLRRTLQWWRAEEGGRWTVDGGR